MNDVDGEKWRGLEVVASLTQSLRHQFVVAGRCFFISTIIIIIIY